MAATSENRGVRLIGWIAVAVGLLVVLGSVFSLFQSATGKDPSGGYFAVSCVLSGMLLAVIGAAVQLLAKIEANTRPTGK